MADAVRGLGLRSVRTTIFTFAVLATLIPALATAWISYRQNRRAITEKLAEQLQGTSGQAAREMDLWLKERLYELRVFSSSYEVSENVERVGARGGQQALERLSDYLRSVKERFQDYDELAVVGPDGRAVASSAPKPGTLHLPDDWLAHARAGDVVLGDPYAGGDSVGTRMAIAVPIVAATGRFLGGLVARVNFRGVVAPLRGFLGGSGNRITVVDRDGQTIVAVAGSTSIGSDSAVPPRALASLRKADGAIVTYDDAHGARTVGALAPIPQANWGVVAAVPYERAFADIGHLRNTTALLVVILLLVVGALAYVLGLLIVRPVSRLTRAAGHVAAGDLDVVVPVAGGGGGELAYLTEVFNGMVGRLREARTELEKLSITDVLTGLVNRRRLIAELEVEIERSRRHERSFSVLMLDVDRFKRFNDRHGHLAGDGVLKGVAARLKDVVRNVDTVARFGGEEFVVMLPEADANEALIVAERIRSRVADEPFPAGEDGTESVTVSIGIAEFPNNGENLEALIAAADAALYRAKRGGRDRVASAKT